MPKRGRPKVVTAQNKRHCLRLITSGGVETAVEVARKLQEDVGASMNVVTVSRVLKEFGVSAADNVKKPMLTAKNIKAD